jgi:hypothetical protein
VGNKPKTQDKDRKARVEAMRREQQARERRKSLMFVIVAVVLGVGLVAAAAVPAYMKKRNDPTNKALSSFGVSAASASCDEPTTDKTSGSSVHVGPGTDQPNVTKVKYAQVPPSSGEHFVEPVFSPRPFYTAENRPAMEELVHNLEHGYSILWYDSTVKGDDLKTLENIAKRARTEDAVGPRGKFIVSAWDDAYGKLPEGKHVALSHWGAQQGHRQLCGKVSGEVVESFIKKFPATDAPEPNAA